MLRRLVIPGALAAIIAGGAIGAAASYLTSQGDTGAAQQPDARAASPGQPRSVTRPAIAGPGPSSAPSSGASPGQATQAPRASAGATDGRALNDEGYTRIRQGEYRAAIPPLRRAVEELRGVGPTDPYEAYANYNLGYALLQVGDCTGALPPLEAANRLESSPLVDAAIRRAAACAHQGS